MPILKVLLNCPKLIFISASTCCSSRMKRTIRNRVGTAKLVSFVDATTWKL